MLIACVWGIVEKILSLHNNIRLKLKTSKGMLEPIITSYKLTTCQLLIL